MVNEQKQILDVMDNLRSNTVEQSRETSGILKELRVHRKNYDALEYNQTSLLSINSHSEYFMQKALQDNQLKNIIEVKTRTHFYRQLGCLAFSLRFWPKIMQFFSNCHASDWTFSFKIGDFRIIV